MKKIFATLAMSMTIVMTASAATSEPFPTTSKYPYGSSIEGKLTKLPAWPQPSKYPAWPKLPKYPAWPTAPVTFNPCS